MHAADSPANPFTIPEARERATGSTREPPPVLKSGYRNETEGFYPWTSRLFAFAIGERPIATIQESLRVCLKTNLLIFNHKKIRFSGGIITVSASISDSNMTPEKDSISYQVPEQVPERPH